MITEKAESALSCLCKCNKTGFEKGEKKALSGYFNQWLVKKDGFMFLWKQKRLYYPTEKIFKNAYKLWNKNSAYNLQQQCIKEGLWNYPTFSYNCCFMYASITKTTTGGYSLYWYSGDDDICYNFHFADNQLIKVKELISKYHRKEMLFNILLSYDKGEDYSFLIEQQE